MAKVRKITAAVLIVLYLSAYYLYIILNGENTIARIVISNIMQTIPPFIVFSFLMLHLVKGKKHKEHFWLFISIGCGNYLFSQLIWDYYEIVLGINNPVFWYSNILWAAAIISYIIALSMKIAEKNNSGQTKLLVVDSLTIMCVACTITWIFIIQPGYISIANHDILSKIVFLAYPAGNLLCLFVATSLYFSLKRKDTDKTYLRILCLAFLVMFTANSIYSSMSIFDRYSTGSLLDPLWSLYIMLLGFAFNEYKAIPSRASGAVLQNQGEELPSRLSIVLPFISVILICSLMLFIQSKIVWLCSTLSICLITLRHAMTIVDNKKLILKMSQLTNSLEGKVAERTQELYNMAFYDQLTGLPNRRMFESNLKNKIFIAYQNHTPLSLMFLDLDRFKTINDNFGHSVGDLMLREIADRIKACVNNNCEISRQGGDEFAIIIENFKDTRELSDIAEKILCEITKPVLLFDQTLHTSCSIGIALYSRSCEDPDTLMRYADAAMYYSKYRGKNAYKFYTQELDKSISKKLELETELSKALDKRELSIYYQPQVNINTGRIVGAEALLRWEHPTLGHISPEDFIPIAEESGMIKEIGQWVMKTACYQAKKLHEEGFNSFKIGVNISSKQIQQEGFIDMVQKVLHETGLKPQYLDLEITESASFQNEAEIISMLSELKNIGVQISIDDFGTGYSSLSYLNKLPIDTLKIAQQFVKSIKNDSTNKAIISSIIALAQNLKLKIIAEGVEENYQYNFLRSQNCFDMQGFIFSKPVPLSQFKALIKEGVVSRSIKLDA